MNLSAFSLGRKLCREARASAVPADQRVTFFAGAKKVTKETPFQSEPPLRMRRRNLQECVVLQVTTLLRKCLRWASNAEKMGCGSGSRVGLLNFLYAASTSSTPPSGLIFSMSLARRVHFRDGVVTWNPSHFPRFRPRILSGGSDSKGCFFGDFLCTSKESYPLAAGQRKLVLERHQKLARAGQRKLVLRQESKRKRVWS